MPGDGTRASFDDRSTPGRAVVGHEPNGIAVVTMFGEHDISNEPVLAHALRLAGAPSADAVIDLSECAFLDSRAITTLMTFAGELAKSGRRVAVALPPSQTIVDRVFALLRIRDVLSVHDTLQEAQEHLSAGRSTRNEWLATSPPMPID
jgi:anti-anti-sigma factor